MKNRTLITKLRQFNPELKVKITAYLQYGCNENGYGSGEYEGFEFSQDYTIRWNDGSIEADKWDGYSVGNVIEVLKEKVLSEISDDDFSLRPGELSNGDPEYKTTWDDEKPEEDDMPDDSNLYNIMDIGDANYEWKGASSLDIEVYYSGDDSDEDDETIMFSLTTDEIDSNPDPIDVIKPVAKKKPGY
jgi:hypothetical protein